MKHFPKNNDKLKSDKSQSDKSNTIILELIENLKKDVLINSYLGHKGYSIPKICLTKEILNYIKKDLIAKPIIQGSIAEPKTFPVYQESDKKIYVPRFYGIKTFGYPKSIKISQGENIKLKFTGDMRDYQMDIIDHYLKNIEFKANELNDINKGNSSALIELKCGGGKCMGINTPILMYSGAIKMVQDIKIGDKLMGDDSKPRNVMSLARGQETLYDIIPQIGNKYTVNESHILSLKYKSGEILDIPLLEYLKIASLPDQLFGYRVLVNFKYKFVKTSPYLLGLYLGNKHRLRQQNNISHNIPDNIPDSILNKYKCNTRNIRLKLLAGIIDSCGIKYKDTYVIIQKNANMLSDIIFITQSLGFAVYKKTYIINNYNKLNEKRRKYYKIFIRGNDLKNICKNPTNICDNRDADILLSPIKVVKKEIDDYYGFEIDGNHRYLLGDMTVTHNTVIALKIIEQIKKKTVIFVHKTFLKDQWIERIQQFLPDTKIGTIQGQIIDIENKEIVIAMIQSISMKAYPDTLFDCFGLAIYDEVHHLSGETFSNCFKKCNTLYGLGLSATMNRKDGLTYVFKMFLGEICYKSPEQKSNDNVLVKAINYYADDDEYNEIIRDFRGTIKYTSMISKVSNYDFRNDFIINVLENELLVNSKQQIILLAHTKKLLNYLYKIIVDKNITSCGFYIGGMKKEALKLSESKQIILATYAMAAEALDIKTLTTLLLATPKSDIIQAVGRILREKHTQPLVIDIVDSHDVFMGQFTKRRAFYKQNEYKIIRSNNHKYIEYMKDIRQFVNANTTTNATEINCITAKYFSELKQYVRKNAKANNSIHNSDIQNIITSCNKQDEYDDIDVEIQYVTNKPNKCMIDLI
tara:strand:- start:134 stop:2728 length:2595 start_codon:yes stop_codon:yes gene_type:complete